MKKINLSAAIILSGLITVSFAQKIRTKNSKKAYRTDDNTEVCAGKVKDGWIKINDKWDPSRCGNPSSLSYNVYIIERIDNRPAGTVISACAVSPVPAGWVKTGEGYDASRCGHPTSYSNNVMNIKKLK